MSTCFGEDLNIGEVSSRAEIHSSSSHSLLSPATYTMPGNATAGQEESAHRFEEGKPNSHLPNDSSRRNGTAPRGVDDILITLR